MTEGITGTGNAKIIGQPIYSLYQELQEHQHHIFTASSVKYSSTLQQPLHQCENILKMTMDLLMQDD